jgi:hypothetical protein
MPIDLKILKPNPNWFIRIKKAAANSFEKSAKKLSTPAAFGNLFEWVPAAFRNPFMKAQAAFGNISRVSKGFKEAHQKVWF